MKGATLDAGALIALERSDRAVALLVEAAEAARVRLAVPAGVLAQVWRDGSRQVPLVRLLGTGLVEVVPLDDAAARAVGHLCALTGATDVVDASVVVCARRRGHRVVTSDPDDLAAIDPRLELIVV